MELLILVVLQVSAWLFDQLLVFLDADQVVWRGLPFGGRVRPHGSRLIKSCCCPGCRVSAGAQSAAEARPHRQTHVCHEGAGTAQQSVLCAFCFIPTTVYQQHRHEAADLCWIPYRLNLRKAQEDAKDAFKQLLRDKGINSDTTWDQAMRLITNDSRCHC